LDSFAFAGISAIEIVDKRGAGREPDIAEPMRLLAKILEIEVCRYFTCFKQAHFI